MKGNWAIMLIVLMVWTAIVAVYAVHADSPTGNVGNQVDLKEGITETTKTAINVSSPTGQIAFTDKTTGISVTTSTLIDDRAFIPAKTTINKTVRWDTANVNPNTSFEFTFLDNLLKENITLKQAATLKFKLKLSWESEVIPWGDTWKIIPLAATDTSRGIVIEKPYGTDATGRNINMSYKYDGKTQVLTLVEDALVPGEKPFVIAYPLVIDPTYNNNPSWTQVAAKAGGTETYIYSLVTYDDGTGTAIYGGTYGNGQLYKYNKTLAAWSLVAAKAGETYIYSLVTYDDGGLNGTSIYGGTANNGKLFKWQTFTTKPNTTFTANVTTGTDPTAVLFTETSTSTGTSWSWKRNNLTWSTGETFSTAQNPVQTFNAGNWSINLTSTNTGGSNLSAQVTWINVTAGGGGAVLPIVQWTIDKQTVRVPGTVTTVDTSLNTPTSWQWYWGDGSANGTSNQEQHKYVKRGVYQAQLTATNAAGSNTSSKQVRVIGYDQLY